MKKYDYLIVGAGLFGCVFAREAVRAGKTCLVIDNRGHIGGNSYTEVKEGLVLHAYGAHIFHTDSERVWNYVNGLVPFRNFINSPIARYRGEVYNLPFNMNTFSKLWGVVTPREAKAKLEEQIAALHLGEPKNLEEQGLKLVGKDVFEKLIKGYTEKQWGKPCNELPAFIIRRIPLRFTYDNNYFNDRYQGIPEGGYTRLAEKLSEGCDVRLSTEYSEFIKEYPDIAEKTVYTGMIDQFYGYRFGELEYRSLRFETERLDAEDFQGNAVVNYTEREIPYTRIIEHKHFEKAKCPFTYITREYPAAWRRGDEPYYPINDEKNTLLYQKYKALADGEKNVLFGGRLGLYRYFDMDKAIEAALFLAERELGKTDEWK